MPETKWTPGLYERSATTVYAVNEEGSNRFSAFVDAGFERKSARPGGTKRTTHEECEATAQLFTAAPDLYEALDEMRALWVFVCNLHGWDPDHMAQHAKAVASLAKARGES